MIDQLFIIDTLGRKRKARPKCTLPGCEKPHCAKGYCQTHYVRLYLRGTVELRDSYYPLIKRLEERILPEPMSGCWIWEASLNESGYPSFTVKGKARRVHRLIYEHYFGPISPGMEVCHRCDQPWCVSPQHLFLGSHSDNMRDMASKGRAYKGNCLTPDAALEVYIAHTTKQNTTEEMATKYGVTRTSILNVVRGKTWRAATAHLRS